MNLPAGKQTWAMVVLGVLSLLLVANLVAQFRALKPKAPRAAVASANAAHPHTARAAAAKSDSHTTSDLAKYDPEVHFDALQAMDSRPMPDEERNPFEFVGVAGPAASSNPVPVPPAPPPPPPPPPLKAMGYNELPGGKKEAMVTLNDDLLVVHEGDVVGGKYKIVKIDPSAVSIEDDETHQTVELPIPQ